MITTKQKLALAALVPVCAGVWGPQVLTMMEGGDAAAQVDVDGPTEAEMMEFIEPMDAGAGGPAPMMPMNDASADAGPAAVAEVGGPDTVIEEVLRALRGAEAFRAGNGITVSTPVQAAADVERGGLTAAAAAPGTAAAFLAAHPLRGTLTGADVRYALLGSYRLREGDALPGTSAVLATVERGRVLLEEDGETHSVQLPPLRIDPERARRSTSGEPGEPNAPTSNPSRGDA